MRRTVTYRPYESGDETKIVSLFADVFDRSLSLDFWRWRFVDNCLSKTFVFLAFDGPKLVGHYGVCPLEVYEDGERNRCGLSMTTMVHKGYRGRDIFPSLSRICYKELRKQGYLFVCGFPNIHSHKGFIGKLSWKDVALIDELSLEKVAAIRLTKRSSVVGLTVVTKADVRFDKIDAVRKHEAPYVFCKDAKTIEWRYFLCPTSRYTCLALETKDDRTGYLFYKLYEDQVDIVDFWARDGDAMTQLLIGLLSHLGERNVSWTKINTWQHLFSPNRIDFERIGFVPGSPLSYFGLLSFDEEPRFVYDGRLWQIQMGDSDVY